MSRNIALIAGEGALPVAIAKKLAEDEINKINKNYKPLILTLRTGKDAEIFAPYAGKLICLKTPNLSRCVRELKNFGANSLIMAGRVPKKIIYSLPFVFLFDKLTRSVITQSRRDDHSLLGAVVKIFEREGIKVIPYWQILPEFIAPEGNLAEREPTENEFRDINYGREILRVTLPCSFGQAIAVAGGAVLAIEAIEGTDEMIKRAGFFLPKSKNKSGKSGVIVKMMREDQDLRYDLPTVGVKTIEAMHDAGLTCLAVEAGRTLIIEPDETLKRAGKYNIAVWGIKH